MSKFRNATLEKKLTDRKPKTKLVAAKRIEKPNTVNSQGYAAHSLPQWLRLLSLLNTSKLQNQYYRSENATVKEVKSLVANLAKEDPYFIAQMIVYSRCLGEGMRSVNHLAAAELGKYISGMEWSKRFYTRWDRKNEKGGTIYRPDDISEIASCFIQMNSSTEKKMNITNAMKRGFKLAIESMDTQSLLKYKSSLIDVINLVHPNPNLSKAKVTVDGKQIPTLTAMMKGMNVSADTWEVAQSDAGQIVAAAVRENKVTVSEAKELLIEAKADNWASLLNDGKLGILAAIRNIRNILLNNPSKVAIEKLCDLLSDGNLIRKGKIMPYQIDLAYEIVNNEFNDSNSRLVATALLKGYETAIPNLAELLSGNNLVILDMSGSMTSNYIHNENKRYKTNCASKAALIAATIAKSTNADVISFGSDASYTKYDVNNNVFSIAKSLIRGMGVTNLAAAWKLAGNSNKQYDRVFILSDNECNRDKTYDSYKSYVEKCNDPYVYSVDLASYGTAALAGPKVKYYFGFGIAMFDDIATLEFNPTSHLDKIKSIVI